MNCILNIQYDLGCILYCKTKIVNAMIIYDLNFHALFFVHYITKIYGPILSISYNIHRHFFHGRLIMKFSIIIYYNIAIYWVYTYINYIRIYYYLHYS